GRFANDDLTPALLDAGVPTVCLSFLIDHPRCCSVDCDNEQGGYTAVRHLINLGHKRIAFLYPGYGVSWGKERHLGALRAMAEAGLSSRNLICYDWAETSLPSRLWVESALEFLRTLKPRPTALVCCDESRAQGLVEALPQVGMRAPDDLAVVGFNSTEISARCRPPLTSVHQPLEEIGAAAVGLLIRRIQGEQSEERCLRFAMRMDVRDSCGGKSREEGVLPASVVDTADLEVRPQAVVRHSGRLAV
ncbi:MAG TPA: substrate-binding domain-containing protein, partial [Chthonomonadales bacterium]|nr:substrate-binding domain-containing protein [Chthonomonadales bacterium]